MDSEGNRVKKFFALSTEDLSFIDKAPVQSVPENFSVWNFKKTKVGYVPEEVSLLNADTSRWYKDYLEEKEKHGDVENPAKFFKRSFLGHFIPDHTFIPLNYPPAHLLSFAGLKYVSPDSFFASEEAWVGARLKATKIFETLASRVNLQQAGWSYNWLANHPHYVQWFFLPLEIAATMAQSIRDENGEFVCIQNTGERYSTHLLSYDMLWSVWHHYLGDAFRVIRYDLPVEYQVFDTAHIDYSDLQGSILFTGVFSTAERHYRTMLTVSAECGIPASFASFSRCYNNVGQAREFADGAVKARNATIYPFPYPRAFSDGEVESLAAYLRDIACDILCYGDETLHAVARTIAQYCLYSENAYEHCVDLFSRHRPRVCVGEANNAAESAAPLLAANRLGIPTIGVPHSYVTHISSTRESLTPARRYAMANKLGEAVVLRHNKDAVVSSFANIDFENEYFFNKSYSRDRVSDVINILVLLTAQTDLSPLSVTFLERSLCQWLSSINAVPEPMRDKISIRYKMHPRFHSFSLLKRAKIDFINVLHPSTPMIDALEASDIVLSCNYIGAPAFQAFMRKKPTVFCLSEDALLATNYKEILKLVKPKYVLSDSKKFWRDFPKIMFDEACKRDLISHQDKIVNDLFTCSKSSLSEWITEFEGHQ